MYESGIRYPGGKSAHTQHAKLLRHAATLDPALLQPLIDAAVRYKVLPQPLDVRDIIWH